MDFDEKALSSASTTASPRNTKALKLLGVDYGLSIETQCNKRPRSAMSRRMYAPPTTPMPSLFSHLYHAQRAGAAAFPSPPRIDASPEDDTNSKDIGDIGADVEIVLEDNEAVEADDVEGLEPYAIGSSGSSPPNPELPTSVSPFSVSPCSKSKRGIESKTPLLDDPNAPRFEDDPYSLTVPQPQTLKHPKFGLNISTDLAAMVMDAPTSAATTASTTEETTQSGSEQEPRVSNIDVIERVSQIEKEDLPRGNTAERFMALASSSYIETEQEQEQKLQKGSHRRGQSMRASQKMKKLRVRSQSDMPRSSTKKLGLKTLMHLMSPRKRDAGLGGAGPIAISTVKEVEEEGGFPDVVGLFGMLANQGFYSTQNVNTARQLGNAFNAAK